MSRDEFEGGGVRDAEEGKPRFDLLLPNRVPYEDQYLTRVARLMARGADRYTTYGECTCGASTLSAPESAEPSRSRSITGAASEGAVSAFEVVFVDDATSDSAKDGSQSTATRHSPGCPALKVVSSGVRNWEQMEDEAAYERFRSSAFRHFMQWFNHESDEDHAAAIFFNVQGAEYVLGRIAGKW